MATDLLAQASSFLPSGSTVYTIIIWFLSIIIIGGLIGGIAWWMISSKRYSRIIPQYEMLSNGTLRLIGTDKARVIVIDKGLARVWYLKKLKMYSQPMVYSSGKLTYPVVRKSDGDLENFELKLAEDGKSVIGKVMPTSIRMANANIRRYFREAYKHDSFMQKWGGMIVFTSSIVVISLVFIYILSEVAKIVPALQQVATTLAQALSQVHCSPNQVVNANP